MPRPRVAMRKIREVLRLTFGEGLSRRQVGASAGVPVTTVSDYVGRAIAGGPGLAAARGPGRRGAGAAAVSAGRAVGDPRPLPDWAYVHRELRRKSVTLAAAVAGVPGGAPRRLRLQPVLQLVPGPGAARWTSSCARSHRAGEKLFVDFPGDTIPIYDRQTGEVSLRAELFVAVAGASSYLYAEAFPSQELLYWVTAHVHALRRWAAARRSWSATTFARASPGRTATSPT